MLHLLLVGTTAPNDSLFDFPRSVFMNVSTAGERAADCGRPCLPQFQRTVGIAMHEYPLHCDRLRREFRNQLANARIDRVKPAGKFPGADANTTAGYIARLRAVGIDNPVPGHP